MENPRHWRLKAQRYRMQGSSCPGCGQVSFPPRPFCPDCTILYIQTPRLIISVSLEGIGITDDPPSLELPVMESMQG